MKATVNRSDKIREYIKTNPAAGPRAVSDALKAKGIKVAPGLVSVVKSKMNTKGAKIKAKAKIKTKSPSKQMSGDDIAKAIISAKELVNFSGSLDKAKNFLDLVSRI